MEDDERPNGCLGETERARTNFTSCLHLAIHAYVPACMASAGRGCFGDTTVTILADLTMSKSKGSTVEFSVPTIHRKSRDVDDVNVHF